MGWSVPTDRSFPVVYSRFERKSAEGNVLKFKIQDCPVEMYEDLMDFMKLYFMRDETWNKALGIEHEELAVEEFHTLQSSYFVENLAQICILDEDENKYDMISSKPQILGFNLLTIVKKDAKHYDFEVKSKAISKIFTMFEEMDNHNDMFERFGVTEVVGDAGVSVLPAYRGLGIAVELLKARVALCKSLGLMVVSATFTSSASQSAAEKAGYEAYYQITYEDFEKKNNFCFNTNSKYIKIMAYVIR